MMKSTVQTQRWYGYWLLLYRVKCRRLNTNGLGDHAAD